MCFGLTLLLNRKRNGNHITKLAEQSGVSNKSLITSTPLRKQIANILQAIHLTQNEMEQFANFMGHTTKIGMHIFSS